RRRTIAGFPDTFFVKTPARKAFCEDSCHTPQNGNNGDDPRRAHLGTTTKSARKRSAAVCGAPAAAARRGHAFWDHSATLGIRTCCGWSFGHSRGPVVVPRCAQSQPIAEVGTLLLAGGFGLQDTLEIVSGDGVVGIEPPGGSQVGCRGWQVSLMRVHVAQLTL